MTKGTLRTVVGDVTKPQRTDENEMVVIPHVCNDLGIMGSGVAYALRKKWEQVYTDYVSRIDYLTKKTTTPILGHVVMSDCEDNIIVANMIAQSGIVGINNSKPIKYVALVKCMVEVKWQVEMMQSLSNVVIHAPEFGGLRAGGNFDFILELINEIWIENGISCVIYKFEE